MSSKSDPLRTEHSRWPRRFALATLIAAMPLVFFGGSVTTLHAGLAIDGWWILEPGRGDHFLWLYPLEKWFRDTGTFVEHTHRQIGSLVGLLAIATVVSTFACERRRSARWMACAALAAIVAQGTLGGLRVLEKSDDLAFLHGVVGQLVFALLGATALVLSRDWADARPIGADRAETLRKSSTVLAVVVAFEIAIGAWLRHGASTLALVVHGVGVILVLAAAAWHARELARARDAAPHAEGRRYARLRATLFAALGLQIALGLAAFVSVYFVVGRQPTELGQALWPTLHVMGGAALLWCCVTSALWCHRTTRAGTGSEVRVNAGASAARGEPRASLGGST